MSESNLLLTTLSGLCEIKSILSILCTLCGLSHGLSDESSVSESKILLTTLGGLCEMQGIGLEDRVIRVSSDFGPASFLTSWCH